MPTPRDPKFHRVPDDPPGTIRQATRRYASLDHALTPLMMDEPASDRATTYPGPRRDQPTLSNRRKATEEKA